MMDIEEGVKYSSYNGASMLIHEKIVNQHLITEIQILHKNYFINIKQYKYVLNPTNI